MDFINPAYLWLLLVLPLIWYLHSLAEKKKKKAAVMFSNLGIIRKASKRNVRYSWVFYLTLLSVALLIIGLSDPHIPLKKTQKGVNVVLAIDISGSMKAGDYQPTRLEAAKRSAEILLDSLDAQDHIGIVTFESGATTAAYLSPFKDKVKDKLRAIAHKDGATAIGDGLSLAVDMATSIPNKKKVVILLSDGVSNSGVISPGEAVEFAKTNKIQVYTVGLGSAEPVILGYDFFGRPQYAELDENTLKTIASETGGEYFKSVDTETLDGIYQNLGKKIEREKEETSIKDWFILGAAIALISELYMRYGGKRIIQ
ncbi:MAG: VWA domain-containing protein [archaeon]